VAVNDSGQFYNRFLFATPDGRCQAYDKRHLFRTGGEHRHYSAGDQVCMFEWRGARLCPQVCYDLRFPVWSRRRPGLDYDLLIYVANWPAARRFAWSALLRARAIENQAFCVGVNRVGADGHGVAHAGDSVALDFTGKSLVEMGDGAQLATVALDIEALRGWREQFPAHLDADAFTLES
jgi:predicted amidohydrolase